MKWKRISVNTKKQCLPSLSSCSSFSYFFSFPCSSCRHKANTHTHTHTQTHTMHTWQVSKLRSVFYVPCYKHCATSYIIAWETYTALFGPTSDWISTPVCGKHTQLCSDWLQTGKREPPIHLARRFWAVNHPSSFSQSKHHNIPHEKPGECHYACLTSWSIATRPNTWGFWTKHSS